MISGRLVLRQLENPTDSEVVALAELLIACVDAGASVSFMLPLPRERALDFWMAAASGSRAGERVLLVAEHDGSIVGTVQVILKLPENQPHRVDVAKLLVHPNARRRGIASALMQAAEAAVRERGRTLMVLDAVTDGDAARLYERLGWTRAGDIPGYALYPAGGLCSTTFYYREVSQ